MIRMEDSREFIIGSNRRKAMAKYDGWTLKSYASRKPHLFLADIKRTRAEVIKELESEFDDHWETIKKRRGFKIVKIKLVEVA